MKNLGYGSVLCISNLASLSSLILLLPVSNNFNCTIKGTQWVHAGHLARNGQSPIKIFEYNFKLSLFFGLTNIHHSVDS